MAFADLAAYKDGLGDNSDIAGTTLNFVLSTGVVGRLSDLWRASLPIGTLPTAAVVPDNNTAGALGQVDSTTGELRIISARVNISNPGGMILIADRLSHQGGLSGLTTGVVTTNLPTAALTRYTSGEGVMIGVTIYTQIGTTATTITASYTNQAGVAGRTTTATVFGGTAFREANRLLLLSLQEGDTGVRSVESTTIAVSTGTAGAFGVMLFKPLVFLPIQSTLGVLAAGFMTSGVMGGLPEVVDGACLFPISTSGVAALAGAAALIMTET